MPLFTRITLNPVNPDVRKVLRSPEAIHQFPGGDARYFNAGRNRPLLSV